MPGAAAYCSRFFSRPISGKVISRYAKEMIRVLKRYFILYAAVALAAVSAAVATAVEPVEYPARSLRGGLQVMVTNATQKLFPGEGLPGPEHDQFEINAVRNEYAPFQVAFYLPDTSDAQKVHIELKDFVAEESLIKAGNAELLLVETVTIEKPSMPYPQRVWPDPLPPYRDFTVRPGETRSVWVDLFVPEDTPPGRYTGAVNVVSGDITRSKQVVLNVASPVIPDKPTLKTAFGLNYPHIAKAHGVEEGEPGYDALMDRYYWFHVEHRISPYHIPVDLFSEEAHEYLDDSRVTFLRAPFTWDREEMERINRRLVETGWIDKAVFYALDEPEPDEFPKVAKIGNFLHDINPDLQMLITHGVMPELQEARIDIWCPVIMVTMDPVEIKKLKAEKKKGKQFWWYTCIGPKWEGTTYFIDEHATAPRIHPWMNYIYDVDGILYWRTTSWKRADYDPWVNTETYPGGNGDGSLLYPGSKVGHDGPVASIRFKNIREGIEDYELLQLLGEKLAGASEKIGGPAAEYEPGDRLYEHAFGLITEKGRSSMLGDRTPFMMFETTDYRVIERQRARVIAELESAGREPLILVETRPIEYGYTNSGAATVRGYIQEGTEVYVNGEKAAFKGRRFYAKAKLDKGSNVIEIKAVRGGAEKMIERTVYKR